MPGLFVLVLSRQPSQSPGRIVRKIVELSSSGEQLDVNFLSLPELASLKRTAA
jgi:hypothetical protein